MKKIIYLLASALAVSAFAPQASATPMYARQTGMECNSCHFQSFPALNDIGRSFKAGGYTMNGAQKNVDGLALPVTLNAGVVTKIRYQQSNGTKIDGTNNTNDGQLQFPDELLLMVGGRVSENIGAQLELNLTSSGTKPVVESFKMPFIYDVGGIKAGVIPFTTATQGVAYGFELLNTGAVRGARIMEARNSFSAQQYIGTATAAEGAAVVASNAMFFLNITKWSPRSVGAANSGSPSATYVRLAITPKIGQWETAVGVQSWSGSATLPTLVQNDTKAYAVDAQVQGEAGSMPVGFYLTYANASATEAGGTTNLFNANANAKTAATIAGQLGVVPGKATLLMAYRKGDTGAAANNDDNSLMLGGTYLMEQNVQLQFNHEMFSGNAYDGAPANGNQLTTLMLFAAF
ncbi:MAG TPA: hypothetical protein VMV48_06445 [Gallionellaceae bacterium]|nr:hypothetical protein [Gallionellaceae bacterium]